tara:strand:- start:303 stop:872 length:570 start_codon:yes stop_codon:yes gene_type:complete
MAAPIDHAWTLLKGRVSDYRGWPEPTDTHSEGWQEQVPSIQQREEAMRGQPAHMKEPLHQISPAGKHSFIPPGFEQLDLGGGFGTSVRYHGDAKEGARSVAGANPNVRTIPQKYNRWTREGMQEGRIDDAWENDASRVLGREVPAEGYQSTLHEFDPGFMHQPRSVMKPEKGEYGEAMFESLPPYSVPA